MSGNPPRVTHVLETSLYVADLDRAQEFYQTLFGFPAFTRDARMAALGVPGRRCCCCSATAPRPRRAGRRAAPSRRITARAGCISASPSSEDDLTGWEQRLTKHGIAIESRVAWPSGSVSLYFRDPDGHSLEVATRGCGRITARRRLTPRVTPRAAAPAGARARAACCCGAAPAAPPSRSPPRAAPGRPAAPRPPAAEQLADAHVNAGAEARHARRCGAMRS